MKNIISFKFEKYHGAGNDFILIEENEHAKNLFTPEVVKKICDRRIGIGADGLIRVKKHNDDKIEMIYHNNDGPIGSFCGNGSRCAISFAIERNWCRRKGTLHFKENERKFEILSPQQIMVEFPIEHELTVWSDGHFINTGSPHVVIEIPNGQLEKLNLDEVALEIRHHEDYLKIGGTNVNYYSLKKDHIQMRTFERGVEEETLACGTGTIAVGMTLFSKYPEKYSDEIVIHASGGQLKVINKNDNLWLQGPVQKVFVGEYSS